MADDAKTPSQNPNDLPDSMSASSIFLEMMRQRAADLPDDSLEAMADVEPQDASRWAPGADSDDEPYEAHADAEDAPNKAAAPPSDEVDIPEDPLEAQKREALREARQQRRRAKRRYQTMSLLGGIIRTVFIVGLTATLTATIFTWWQGPEFLSATVRDDLSVALATATSQGISVRATALPVTPNWLRRVGVISGHRGPENDPGAVCPDGLTEAEINLAVAERVVRNLQARGYTVDLLDEFDPRLTDYKADMLLSIHANTCQDYGEFVSGYLISTADSRVNSGSDQLLVECVASYYGRDTQLDRRYGLTRDVTDYHVFRKIHPRTPGAIIELGFMLADRDLLTTQHDLMAGAITNGILCYLEPESPNILATLQAPDPTEPPPLPTVFSPDNEG